MPATLEPRLQRASIAYFSMEIGLRPEIHTYSGGLGVLAGDVARSAVDLELPMVFVTLASQAGYVRQELDDSSMQIDHPDPWDLARWAAPLGAMASVDLEGRRVWIQPWLYELRSPAGGAAPVILLDTNISQNDERDRGVTDRLYGGDGRDRLKQEAVLGIGGGRVLDALGFSIATYHLNEGHAALLPASLLRSRRRENASTPRKEGGLYDVDAVRRLCVFTTHTPVEAGHDRFSYDDVSAVLGDWIEMAELRALGGSDVLNMTRLALNLSGFVNGVAKRHAETASTMFPGYRVRAITNGVHVRQWTHRAMAALFQQLAPHWCHEPESLARADMLPDQDIWAAHEAAKRDLVAVVEQRTGRKLDPDLPTIAFARRMTGYKRPDLLFSDLGRLKALAARFPFQILVAGKAHPRDDGGKALIQQIVDHSRELGADAPTVFVPGYDMELAASFVAGSDVWLNTPLPPLEASGTSGMKAALNGGLNLSILDGWWIEAWEEGVTGWAVDAPGETDPAGHAESLYGQLEHVVLPLYHQNRPRWIWMMKQAISRIGPVFNSQHMMRRYASEAYLR